MTPRKAATPSGRLWLPQTRKNKNADFSWKWNFRTFETFESGTFDTRGSPIPAGISEALFAISQESFVYLQQSPHAPYPHVHETFISTLLLSLLLFHFYSSTRHSSNVAPSARMKRETLKKNSPTPLFRILFSALGRPFLAPIPEYLPQFPTRRGRFFPSKTLGRFCCVAPTLLFSYTRPFRSSAPSNANRETQTRNYDQMLRIHFVLASFTQTAIPLPLPPSCFPSLT